MELDAVLTDRVAAGVERISLRSPTLPPATHTNCYLVGETDFYVVEPASGYPAEVRALHAAVRARLDLGHRALGAILTHHHRDHVGGAHALREAFGIPLRAHPRTCAKLGAGLAVDECLDEGDPALGKLGVEVLHTPGHAPGHLCLWSREHGWLIAGDMVASVGTILIDPTDDGDMTAYLTQLQRLASLRPRRMLPAHGEPIEDATARLVFYYRHRLDREARVLASVDRSAPSGLGVIVARAYADTPGRLWPLAARSALAHLARLADLGDVMATPGGWRRTDGRPAEH